ncbi:MAG: integration host factor subunit beta [Candidatus Latescibacteria bacterium]|nr:integration host factor subunit beta [Candidatus Latescibacterota bacterium]
MTLTKYNIVEKISKEFKPRIARTDVLTICQMFLDEVSKALLSGNRVEFRDFGVFRTKLRKPKVGRNPKTNVPLHIPPRLVVVFKPGKNLKAKIAKK